MSKNYEALHHIQKQLSDYDNNLSNAIQRLFNIEDQRRECAGCVIDSVVAALIFKKFDIILDFHLGEICADGKQDAYHCWLTLGGNIFDIGIYGNSNYNPWFRGPEIKHPFIFENPENIEYFDGSTETKSWLAELSEKSVFEYIKHCPQNMVFTLFCKSLDIAENQGNYAMMCELAKDMSFPMLKKISVSPSGHTGINQ